MKFRWNRKYSNVNLAETEKLRKDLLVNGSSFSLNQTLLLSSRGYDSLEKVLGFIKKFTTFKLEDFFDPFLLPDMDKAVARLREAIVRKEIVLIFGDYDCDGITSIVILHRFFSTYCPDLKVRFYQPSRRGKGYGFNRDGVYEAKKIGATLIITVDCGVTNNDVVDYARAEGVDVIVTDHHEVPDILPNAIAVLDPKRHDFFYPFKSWAGVGVAFYLVMAVSKSDSNILKNLRMAPFLELAAIGTVGDIVPLTDDNRTIVKAGFLILDSIINGEKGINKGIREIRKLAESIDHPIGARDVAFGIVPRLNAASRVDEARHATDLLISDDDTIVTGLAEKLEEMNTKRKKTQEELCKRIEDLIRDDPRYLKEKIIIYASDDIDEGVRGIAAGRISELFFRPVIIFSIDKRCGLAVGSARSIDDLNMFDALKRLDNGRYYDKWGGHAAAAGLSVRLPVFDEFVRELKNVINTLLAPVMLVPCVDIDAPLGLEEARPDYQIFLDRLEPFGAENEKPLFLVEDVRILEVYVNSYKDKYSGKEKNYLSFKLVSGDDIFKQNMTLWDPENYFGIKSMDAFDRNQLRGHRADIVVNVSCSEKNGQKYFNMTMIDMDLKE